MVRIEILLVQVHVDLTTPPMNLFDRQPYPSVEDLSTCSGVAVIAVFLLHHFKSFPDDYPDWKAGLCLQWCWLGYVHHWCVQSGSEQWVWAYCTFVWEPCGHDLIYLVTCLSQAASQDILPVATQTPLLALMLSQSWTSLLPVPVIVLWGYGQKTTIWYGNMLSRGGSNGSLYW